MVAGATGTIPLPEAFSAVKAAFAQVNATGGVNGHQLVLKTCDSTGSPNADAQCYRAATSSDAVAMIGSQVYFNPAADWKLVQAAKMPVIGTLEVSLPPELQSPYSFPLWAADSTTLAGTIVSLARHGCKTVASILQGTLAAYQPEWDAGLQAGAKLTGVKVLSTALTPQATPDWTPYVDAAVSKGADCIAMLSGNPADAINAQEAAKANPAHPLVAMPAFEPPKALLKSAGANATGLLLISAVPMAGMTAFPLVTEYSADVHKYEPGAKLTINGIKGWLAAQAFIDVARHLKTFTRASVLQAMNSSTIAFPKPLASIDFAGPPVDPQRFPQEPRVRSADEYFGIVKNGAVQLDAKVGPDGVVNLADVGK